MKKPSDVARSLVREGFVRRNPADATMRNVQAAHKRLDRLEAKVDRFFLQIAKTLAALKKGRR